MLLNRQRREFASSKIIEHRLLHVRSMRRSLRALFFLVRQVYQDHVSPANNVDEVTRCYVIYAGIWSGNAGENGNFLVTTAATVSHRRRVFNGTWRRYISSIWLTGWSLALCCKILILHSQTRSRSSSLKTKFKLKWMILHFRYSGLSYIRC